MTLPSPSTDPLISAAALHAALGRPRLKVLDVRGTWTTPARALPQDYAAGHIPGAVFADWTTDFLEPNVPLNLASVSDEAEAAESFARLGIDPDDTVVLYDDNRHMFAGRLWWAMRLWGFENVRVLDGGLRHWVAEGFGTSTDSPLVTEGRYRPSLRPQLNVSLEEFLERRQQACVLDGRGASGYAGKAEDPRTGHIPGALSVPHGELLDPESGCFLADADLIAVFDRRAPQWRTIPVISSCGAGYSGTVPMLALAKLGISSSLFDGSFAVWKQDPTRAIEQSRPPAV